MTFLIILLIIAILWPSVAKNIISLIGIVFGLIIILGIIGTITG